MSILEVHDVSIRYMTGDFKDIGLKEYVVRKLKGDYHIREFWADKNVSFTLEKGDMLGIIGTNGAGKSTLLKVVSGIMEPTGGWVKREGNIAALLELASGFDGDLTVRENTYLRGAMLGYTRKFMDEMYDQIIEFAELQDFQDRPFKQLSSGMKSRLAFSIASLVQPDILILDEVLSVGDGAFRKKSEAKMREIISGGATTILVSHSIAQVREMCSKILWLHKGEQVEFGDDVKGICDEYQRFLTSGKSIAEFKQQGRAGQDRTGQDRTGQDRTGQDRTGQDRTGQDRTGQDRTVLPIIISAFTADQCGAAGNQVFVDPEKSFLLNGSTVRFEGKNNILFVEDGVQLNRSSIRFCGDNSVIYLSRSKHPYHLNISVHHNSAIYIGKDCYTNDRLSIIASEQQNIILGDESLISFGVFIRTADPHVVYSCETKRRLNLSQSVLIGDHVWIGQNVLILKGTKIGSGSIVGGGACIAGKTIKSNVAVGGNPAKLIRENVFFLGNSVHAWTGEITEQYAEVETEQYTYCVSEDTMDMQEVDEALKKSKSAQERLENIRTLLVNSRDKNRFSIT